MAKVMFNTGYAYTKDDQDIVRDKFAVGKGMHPLELPYDYTMVEVDSIEELDAIKATTYQTPEQQAELDNIKNEMLARDNARAGMPNLKDRDMNSIPEMRAVIVELIEALEKLT